MVVQKKIKKDDSHQFAFFLLNTEIERMHDCIVIRDEDLVHRMFRVVRLEPNDICILFDTLHHYRVEINKIDKKQVICSIIEVVENTIHIPFITYLLPLLKKEALQEAVYSLVEIGVNRIQLVATSKSRQQILDKEFAKLEKVVIAAAEQSKHYALPDLGAPQKLESYLQKLSTKKNKILFDIEGTSFFDFQYVREENEVFLLIGPEGGLTNEEKEIVLQSNFKSCLLTPTVLRAIQAVSVSAAMFRLK